MKRSINKIYNTVINYLIESFHMTKKYIKRKYKKIKFKFKKFYFYEIMGIITISVYFYKGIKYIYNSKYILMIRKSINKYYNLIKKYIIKYYKKYKKYLNNAKIKNEEKINSYKEEYSKYMTRPILAKSFLLIILTVFVIYDAYSWFYSEYQSKGTKFNVGTVIHEVSRYDKDGKIIGSLGDTITVIEEDNLSNTFKNTSYIVIRNTGSLDLDYNLSFTLDGTMSNAGILYYRVTDVTEDVISETETSSSSKLEVYAKKNPTPESLETDAINPVSNLTTIPQLIIKGEIDKDNDDDENNYRYYRIDYGMYQTIDSSLYSGASVAVHANVYSTQRGIDYSLASEGQIWLVENEIQFRDAVLNALSGDTIKLADNISIDGSIDFGRRVHLDTDIYNLEITGDLVYDFVEIGSLNINTSSGGKIDIGSNLYINTPKSQIHFIGTNKDYDIFVGSKFTVNGIQNEEEDGVLLEAVRIVKNKTGNIPVDMYVMSNTRVTIAPNVEIGYLIAEKNSTNIEILNNGTITQIQLQDMNLIDSFSKYQIYVYNLNTILGVLGGSSIILPEDSTPYTGPNKGNTLIIKGVSSNDITVSGSDNFDSDDINIGAPDDSVFPIQGEDNSYYVYIRDNNESLESLLVAYFNELNPSTTSEKINNIKKLIIYTINSAYFENEDFDYVDSTLSNIEYLGLSNATVIDDKTINKIADNTLKNKTSLKTIILPKTLTTIGNGAFENVNLGRIYSNKAFEFLTIPSSVTSIGSNSFKNAKYVTFEGQVPPSVGSNSFNSSVNGTKFFVPIGAIDIYSEVDNINTENVYYESKLSDNKLYFLYDYEDGYGISYFINTVSVGTSLTIPNTLTLSSVSKPITAIGYNAYRNLNTDSSGTTMVIPSTVSLIDSYSFYKDNIIDINLDNVVTINDYAFYDTNITELESNTITSIGAYTFYDVPLNKISLENINDIGSYAFYNNSVLYEANLGLVHSIGDYAFYNCPQLGRVWFKNTDTVVKNNSEEVDLTVGSHSVFDSWAMYLDGRLRVYVPNGSSSDGLNYLDGYKKLFSDNESYIYPTGTIVGSYKHVAIPYDFGEYSLRPITKLDKEGNQVSGYEIIEYHGADLTSDYQFPDIIVSDNKVSASIISGNSWSQGDTYGFGGTLEIKNNTNETINDWTIRLYLPNGVSGLNAYGNANVEIDGNVVTLSNVTYNGTINASGSYNLSFYYDMTSSSLEASVLNAYTSTSNVMNIISIGEYAYRHTISTSGHTILLEANNLLNISNHGLENISVKSLTSDSLITIGDYALYNTGLQTVDLPNLNSMGKYAMSGMDTLYSVNLGNIEIMKENAISNNPNLEQIFIGTVNTDNMSVHSTAMSNIGTNAKDRLRIYVPESKVDYYKALFSNYSEYIFETGYIVGTFINTPIPYDIGEYSVKEVTLKDRDGNDVSGWQIIEYHGPDISNTFKLPLEYTVNGITKDVISIGDYAFKHTSVNESGSTDIVNNKLINIGSHCFEGITSIRSFSSNSLLILGSYAFNNASVVYLDIPNVRSIGSYAISNMTTTYKLNLGKVSNMEPNALYNLPNLLQTYFTPTTENRVFDKYAITDVGTQTNNRIRFYVSSTSVTEVKNDTKQTELNITESCSQTSSGSYWNRTYTNVCTVTVNNNTDKNINSWTTTVSLNGHSLTSSSVSNALYETTSSSVIFTNTSTNGTLEPNGSVTFTYTLTGSTSRSGNYLSNSKGNYIETNTVTYDEYLTEEYASSFRDEYHDYFFDYGVILGNYTSSSIPYDIGEYSVVLRTYTNKNMESITGYEIVEYHGANLTNQYIIPESITVGSDTYPVIGIGKNAYRFTTMSSGNLLDISSSSLLYINDYAFYKLSVRNLNLQNVEYLGKYSFYENSLYKVTTNNLNYVDNYAFAHNTDLNYINLGTVSTIGEGVFYGCSNIEQMFFTTTDVDSSSNSIKISIGTNAFYNAGTTIGKRLRIYVPDGNLSSSSVTYQQAYKNAFPSNLKDYIYPTGYIIGSYKYGSLPYDIGEYSVREVTVKNALGSNVSGFEIIEYHGSDINSSFALTSPLTVDGKTNNIVSIGTYAFYGVSVVSGYEWELTLPDSVVLIGDYAFYKTDITKVNGNQISRLGKYSFADCENLTSIIFNSVIVADDYCLYSCAKISYIQFGSGTTTIGQYALWNPYQGGPTTTLYMQVSSVPDTASNALPEYTTNTFLGITLDYNSNFTYNVPSSVSSSFKETVPWKYHILSQIYFTSDYLYIVDGDTAVITGYTGSGFGNGNLEIPNEVSGYTVTSISANAFDNSTYLTSITLPASMNKLSDGFLDNNTSISNIYVNSENTTFSSKNGILYDYSGTILMRYPNGKSDTIYTIPDDTKVIAYRAFANNTTLTNVIFNSSLETIGAYAFDGCTSIITYTFNSDVPSLTAYDTFDKNSLTSISVPSTYLDNYKNDSYFKEYINYLN